MKGILSVSIPGLVDGWNRNLQARAAMVLSLLTSTLARARSKIFLRRQSPFVKRVFLSVTNWRTACEGKQNALLPIHIRGRFSQMMVSPSVLEILSIRKTWVRPCGKSRQMGAMPIARVK